MRLWLRVIGVALLVALVLRVFAFEAYRIPSSSMEGTLLVGDFLFVSKLNYGARTPVTLGIPFTGLYLENVELPWTRLPGWSEVGRGDVIVFNYPPDRALLDRKMHYIKRAVALPGDTLSIVDKRLLVGGVASEMPSTGQQLYRIMLGSDLNVTTLDSATVGRLLPRLRRSGSRERLFDGTEGEAALWRTVPEVASVEPYVRPYGDRSAPFPLGAGNSLDNFGPVLVPHEGLTVTLTDDTWPAYRDAIVRFEGHDARRVSGGYEIDGGLTDQYTFAQDYYFVMGDNRDDSADSRTWGFVPESHLVGKAMLVYFSWDPQAEKLRWERIFSGIR